MQNKKNLAMRSLQSIGLLAFVFALLAVSDVHFAAAATDPDWSKVGIDATQSVNSGGIFKDLNVVVGIIIAIGGLWVVCCLIFAGMRLSAAQGGNPQARTQGIIGIVCAIGGGWVIMKCYTIAGWVAGFGHS